MPDKIITNQRSIFASMILVGIIPVLVLAIVSTLLIGHHVRDEQLRRDHALTKQISRQIEQLIVSTVKDLELLATDPKLVGPHVKTESRKRELARLTRPGRPEISLLDKSGFVVETTGKISEVQDYSPWFSSAVSKQKTVVSNPYRQAEGEPLLISCYIPVAAAKATQTAIIKATLSFDRISEILASVEPARTDFLALVDGRGNLLDATAKDVPLDALKAIGLQNRQSGTTHGTWRNDDTSSLVYSTHEVSPPNQLEFTRTWVVAYFRDPAGIMAIVYQSYRYKAIAAAIGILSTLLFGWLLSKRLSRVVALEQGTHSQEQDFELKVFVPERRGRRDGEAS